MIDRRKFLKFAAATGCGLIMAERLNGLLTPADVSERYDLVVVRRFSMKAKLR